MPDFIEDLAYLEEWWRENWTCWIKPYIEDHFHPESYYYQANYMHEHLLFTKKIIQDYRLSIDEKMYKFMQAISYGQSKIITIAGGRGSGKTALVMFVVEKIFEKGFHKRIYYVKQGERPAWLPDWMICAQNIEHVQNGSIAIIDETAIEYSSRNFYKEENKSFTERLAILRHKDVSVFLITQHTKMIDINIRRFTDIMIYKMGANVEKDESRKKDNDVDLVKKRLMPRTNKDALVEFKKTNTFYVIETDLASFWDDSLVSKTYKDYNPEERRRRERTKAYQYELQKHREKEDIRAEAFFKKGLTRESKPKREEKQVIKI